MTWFRKFDPRRRADDPLDVLGESNAASARKFFKDLSKESVAKQLAVGGISGWCSGYLSCKVGKAAALAVGGGLLLIQIGVHKGYIKVNWKKVDSGLDAVQNQLAKQDASTFMNSLKRFAKDNVFVAGAFAGGFLIRVATS